MTADLYAGRSLVFARAPLRGHPSTNQLANAYQAAQHARPTNAAALYVEFDVVRHVSSVRLLNECLNIPSLM
jgi:hypothetical protein